jgi:hypothetical protein
MNSGRTCDESAVLELRQYTHYPGQRDVLIELFEREFIESQEAVGAQVVGQFRDLDRPERFVWLRGFRDMQTRREALQAFYDGPVWKAHREKANATMMDSSNVLLLRRVNPESGFGGDLSERPAVGTSAGAPSLVVAHLYYMKAEVSGELVELFERKVGPLMTETGARPMAYFQTETAENNFPRLPVRRGENVLLWFCSFHSQDEYARHLSGLEGSKSWTEAVWPELSRHLKGAPERLRLEPTARSRVR